MQFGEHHDAAPLLADLDALAAAPGGDARPVGKALNTAFAGRGGGKPELVQGSVAGEQAAIAAHLAAL